MKRLSHSLVLLLVTGLLASCFNVPHTSAPEMTTEVDDWRDEVIYQILVDRFEDGDPNSNYKVDTTSLTAWHGGDWQGVIDRFDYLEELGVTTLWISPSFKVVEED